MGGRQALNHKLGTHTGDQTEVGKMPGTFPHHMLLATLVAPACCSAPRSP